MVKVVLLPLHTADGPLMAGAGVVLIIALSELVLLQLPLAVVRVRVPDGPAPHTTFTVEAVLEPEMVPPVTLQL